MQVVLQLNIWLCMCVNLSSASCSFTQLYNKPLSIIRQRLAPNQQSHHLTSSGSHDWHCATWSDLLCIHMPLSHPCPLAYIYTVPSFTDSLESTCQPCVGLGRDSSKPASTNGLFFLFFVFFFGQTYSLGVTYKSTNSLFFCTHKK